MHVIARLGTQMREQKIAEELGKTPGKDFPDVFKSGPYGVRLDPTATPPRSTPPSDAALPIDPMGYDTRTSADPIKPMSLQLGNWSAPRLVRVNGATTQAAAAASSVPAPESEGAIGLVSGQPMRFFKAPIFDLRTNSDAAGNWFTAALLRGSRTSQPSSLDVSTSQAPFASDGQISFGSGNAATPANGAGDAFAPPASSPQDSQVPLSLNDAYLLYRKRLDANQSPLR